MNVLDLFAEFRNMTNGMRVPCGHGLLGAMTYFGLDGMGAVEKDGMRELAMRGEPYSDDERKALIEYCQTDVDALAKLLPRMASSLDLPRALLRGRYMAAAARIEHCGIPIDVHALQRLQVNWNDIQDRLIQRIDADYGVFDGHTFKRDRFAKWLVLKDIPWPQLPSGGLALDDDTFREMSRAHPELAPLRELRHALSQMRLSSLAVGTDGRNRCLLSAFRSITGRNQPSNTRFIFGPSVWLRSLIRPTEGFGLAYIDWCQQEFGIAAALSGDKAMQDAYNSGDPYLTFAIQAKAAPKDATKTTHGQVREQFKACALAVQYGMGAKSLAVRINRPEAAARELLRLHHETYSTFWEWSDAAVDTAMLIGELQTGFGWKLHVGPRANPRSIRNFPMQANGAEMLRLACIGMTEAGIRVCAPVHDAVLIEAPVEELDETVSRAQKIMSDASAAVLGGFRLRSDAENIRYPDRYSDERGLRMWSMVCDLLNELEKDDDQPQSDAGHVRQNTAGTCRSMRDPSNLIYMSNMDTSNNEGPTFESASSGEASANKFQPIETATPVQEGQSLSKGADTLEVAGECRPLPGQGTPCSDHDLVQGRHCQKQDCICFPFGFERHGSWQGCSSTRTCSTSEGGFDPGETNARAVSNCDVERRLGELNDPELWECFNERASIAEYDGGLSRAEAERLALDAIEIRLLRVPESSY